MSKKLLIGAGLLALAGFAFKDKLFGSSTGASNGTSTTAIDRGYSVTYPGQTAVWQVIGGKKFAFISPDAYNAFQALGKTDFVSASQAEVESLPNGGFVDSDGRAKDNFGGIFS